MTTKLKASFKKDTREQNGLDTDEFRKHIDNYPLDRRYAVVLIEPHKTEIVHSDGGVHVPTVAVIAVEPLDGADEEVARETLNRRFRARTGRVTDIPGGLFEHEVGDPDGEPQPIGEILAGHVAGRGSIVDGASVSESAGVSDIPFLEPSVGDPATEAALAGDDPWANAAPPAQDDPWDQPAESYELYKNGDGLWCIMHRSETFKLRREAKTFRDEALAARAEQAAQNEDSDPLRVYRMGSKWACGKGEHFQTFGTKRDAVNYRDTLVTAQSDGAFAVDGESTVDGEAQGDE